MYEIPSFEQKVYLKLYNKGIGRKESQMINPLPGEHFNF